MLYLFPLQLLLYESTQRKQRSIQFQWVLVGLFAITLGQYLFLQNNDAAVSQIRLLNLVFNCIVLFVGSVVLYVNNDSRFSAEQKLLYSACAALLAGCIVGVFSVRSKPFLDFIASTFSMFTNLPFSEDDMTVYITSIASLLSSGIFMLNWIGVMVARRFFGKKQGEQHVLLARLEALMFPPYAVWIGMGAFILLIFNAVFATERPVFLVLVANTVGVLFILYFLQGMGLSISYLRYRRLSEHRIAVIMTLLVVFSILPYLGTVIVVVMCVVGIAKLWVRIPKQGTDK